MKKLAVVLIAVALVAIVASAGCTSSVGEYSTSQDVGDDCELTDYNNGVVFFGCTEGKFASSLSEYISTHNVIATTSSPIPIPGAYNAIYGYVVTFSEKDEVDPFRESDTTTWYYCNAANTSECWKNASDIPLYSARATMYRGA